MLFAYADDLPEISALDDYRPNTITRLLARDGQVIGEFATERRVVIGYDDMAPVLRQAIIATEDADFEQHFGLSISRIVITALKDVVYRPARRRQHDHPAARAQPVPPGLHAGRRLRAIRRCRPRAEDQGDAIVAIQLEKRYTKREIFTFYANQINLGHGAYGVEAASRLYFDKPAKDLTLEEAATIAAIIQTPARLSPFVNPERTLARRNNYVLPRMADEGFITARGGRRRGRAAAGRCRASRRPSDRSRPTSSKTSARCSSRSTAPTRSTRPASRCRRRSTPSCRRRPTCALDRGLRRHRQAPQRLPQAGAQRRRRGARRSRRSRTPRWSQPILAGDIVPAVVTSCRRPPAARRASASARTSSSCRAPRSPGRGRTSAADLFKVGDLIEVEVRTRRGRRAADSCARAGAGRRGRAAWRSTTAPARSARWSAASASRAASSTARRRRGARSGRCSSRSSTPPRSTAASRRSRSSSTSRCRTTPGPNQPPYQPLNYDRKFEGPVTLRRALEQSRNIPAVKAMLEARADSRSSTTPSGFGLPRQLSSRILSLALGSAEATLRRDDERLLGVPEPGRPHDAVRRRRRSPTAKATSSRRTGPSRTKRSAPTPRSS